MINGLKSLSPSAVLRHTPQRCLGGSSCNIVMHCSSGGAVQESGVLEVLFPLTSILDYSTRNTCQRKLVVGNSKLPGEANLQIPNLTAKYLTFDILNDLICIQHGEFTGFSVLCSYYKEGIHVIGNFTDFPYNEGNSRTTNNHNVVYGVG